MKPTLYLSLLATVAMLRPAPAPAQQLTLDQLIGLLESPTPAPAPHPALPGWDFRPTESDPLTWCRWLAPDPATTPPDAQLSLCPNHGSLDVVLRFHRQGLFYQLRRELERRHITQEAVTCLGCEGVRYTAAHYTVALYSGKPGPWPLVVVVHATTPRPSAPPASARQ